MKLTIPVTLLLAFAGMLPAQPRLVEGIKPKPGAILKAWTPTEEPKPKRQIKDREPIQEPEQERKLVIPAKDREPETFLSQADAVILAAKYADPSSRFIWLGDVPQAELADWQAVVSGHVNMLSTEADIVRPGIVPGSNGRLLRIDIADYGWKRELWEKLGENEPYFNVRVILQVQEYKIIQTQVVTPWPGGVWPDDGRSYPAGSFNVRQWVDKKVPLGATVGKPQAALAPWLVRNKEDQEAGSQLLAKTATDPNQPFPVPIISGRWFVFWSGRQKDRTGSGYYDFIGIKKIADVDKLAGFDAKLLTQAKRKELLEAVSISGVSHQPRRIAMFPTIGTMKMWRTFDSNLATEKNNSLRILDNENFLFDASETFFSLPNGLWGFALSNQKGDLQDNVPDNVGVGPDTTTHNNDGRIHVGLSCIRCHFGHGGLNPIDGWARNGIKSPTKLQAYDPALERDLRQKYLKDLEGPLDDDRKVFARALLESTGMKPEEYADVYKRVIAEYDPKEGIDAARAARELGTDERTFKAALLSHMKKVAGSPDSLDLVLNGFLHKQSIHIQQWWEVIPKAHEILAKERK